MYSYLACTVIILKSKFSIMKLHLQSCSDINHFWVNILRISNI